MYSCLLSDRYHNTRRLRHSYHHASTTVTYTSIDMSQQTTSGTLSRQQVTIDGEQYRMYGFGRPQYPSVSTVLDARPTPDKDSSLESWRQWQRSQPDKPDPKDILRFKSDRGTLAHYKCLDPLQSDDLAGDEEISAYKDLKDMGEYNHDSAMAQAEQDTEWVVSEFEKIRDKWLITPDSVRAVERYVYHHDHGYAGQFDLAYDQPDGTTTIADIKTSKAYDIADLFDKKFPRYGMQLAAYANAATFDVDAYQIIWIAPDTKQSSVITHRDFPQSMREYRESFLDICDEVHQSTFNDFDPDADAE